MKIKSRVLVFCVLLVFSVALRAEEVPATRAAFLKLIDRPRVDPKPELGEEKDDGELKTVHFTYFSEEGEKVPGLAVHLSVPMFAKLPVVIIMHGTGGTKDSQGLLTTCAKRGALAIAIDGRYHGERNKGLQGTEAYNEAILKKFKGEQKNFPLYWDTVWDVMRLIDILSAREDVDASKIGVIGFSKGGIETYFLAAADPRVAVAIPCIGVQTFKWGLENNAWKGRVNTVKKAFEGAANESGVGKPDAEFARKFFDKVVPGIYGEFDGPEMLSLIAPRPLMIINGDTDEHTPLPGVKIAAEKAKAIYEKAGASEKFKQIVEEKTGHKVNKEVQADAVEWLAKWLKPE